MKKLNFLIFLTITLILTFSLAVKAQDEAGEEFRPSTIRQARPNLLRELGLSREQMQAIRRLNAERKIQMQEAQQMLGEARRNLDLAIYADNVNESEVKARLQDFQTAQAEVATIRSTTEFEIRKILTPEQVARFRQLRREFAEKREVLPNRPRNRRQNPPNNQPNRFVNRQNQKPQKN